MVRFFFPSSGDEAPDDKPVLMTQKQVEEVMTLAEGAPVEVIGTPDDRAFSDLRRKERDLALGDAKTAKQEAAFLRKKLRIVSVFFVATVVPLCAIVIVQPGLHPPSLHHNVSPIVEPISDPNGEREPLKSETEKSFEDLYDEMMDDAMNLEPDVSNSELLKPYRQKFEFRDGKPVPVYKSPEDREKRRRQVTDTGT